MKLGVFGTVRFFQKNSKIFGWPARADNYHGADQLLRPRIINTRAPSRTPTVPFCLRLAFTDMT